MIISQIFRSGARWSVLLLSIFFPISIALGNLLLGTLLICGLLGYSAATWGILKSHPVARAAGMLFVALLLGCTYGEASATDAAVMIGKYADLAFIPLLLAVFKDDLLRTRAENGFLLAMLVTAILSWQVGLHILGASTCMWDGCSADNPSIFVNSIAHNSMMAFASFLFALRAASAVSLLQKMLYIGGALLTGSDVLFMVLGRTGYVAMGVLLTLFVWSVLQLKFEKSGHRIGWKQISGVILLAVLAIWSAYQFSPRLHERVDMVVSEASDWRSQGRDDTSTGLRLEFYTNSAKLVAQNLWVGVGTGGFAEAYRKLVESTTMLAARNPHNEYLHLTIQLGFVGLVLYLFYLLTQWKTARQLPDAHSSVAAQGMVLTLLVSGMFNTPLMDHVEGLFFAYMSALFFATYIPAEVKRA